MRGMTKLRAPRRHTRWIAAFMVLLFVASVTSALADSESSESPIAIPPSPAFDEALAAGEDREGLTNPEAAEELPLSDLDRQEALEVTEEVFGPKLIDAAGPFAELQVEEFLSNHAALTSASSGSEGEEALLESTLPLRTEGEGGAMETVNLQLENTENALEPAAPLVPVAIPHELGEGLRLPETGVGISLAEGPTERSPSVIDGSVATYPNVATDTDLSVAPTPTGVETLTTLRSAESPHSETFNLSLPKGASLHEAEGGAEVEGEGETILSIPPPSAIDANGDPVPVAMSVGGGSITLEVAMEPSTALPVMVDPIFQSYTWWGSESQVGKSDWHSYTNNANLIPFSKNPFGTVNANGLFVWANEGSYAAGATVAWNYFVPRLKEEEAQGRHPTSFITKMSLQNVGFATSLGGFYPALYAGIWDSSNNFWAYNDASKAGFGYAGNGKPFGGWALNFENGEPGKRDPLAQTGIGAELAASASGSVQEWARDAYFGDATIEVADETKPTLANASFPSHWVNQTATEPISVEAGDTGLGVKSVSFEIPGQGTKTVSNSCVGTAASPCPRLWKASLSASQYNPALMPTGKDLVTIQTEDVVGNRAASSETVPIKVDHTPPTLALSGTLTEENRVGPTLGSYSLGISATDGTEAEPQSGAAETVVEVDGKVLDEFRPGCSTKNCSISHEWTLDSSKFAAGSHKVTVEATDAVGLSTWENLTISLQPVPAPAISLAGTMTEQNTIGTTRPRYKLKVDASAEAGQFGPSTYSTSFGGYGTTAGKFNVPQGMAVDSKGFIWVVDRENARIQKLKENGEYSTKFGSFGEAAGKFRSPADIAIDSKGNLWVADSGNNRVEEFNEKKEFLASFGSAAGKSFKEPESIAVDSKDNVWVADTHGVRIAELNSAGETIRIAGSKGELSEPAGIAVGPGGEVWVADRYEDDVVEFSETGQFLHRFGSEGSAPLQFERPDGIEVDAQGNVWVADLGNDRVQELGEHGEYLGQFGSEGEGPGQFRFGPINYPTGITTDGKGDVLLADTEDNRIERWQIPSFVPSAAGSFGSSGGGEGQLYGPAGMAKDPQGDIWVADLENSRLEQFSPGGEFLASVGSKGSGDGQLNRPTDIAIDAKGNLWVADGDNCRVEEFSESGKYLAKFSDSETAPPSCRRAEGIAVDDKGHIWVTDSYFSRLEEYTEAGERIRVFGVKGTGEGQLKYPTGIAIGIGGNLWVSDRENNRVLEFTPEGSLVMQFGSEGTTAGRFKQPGGLDIDERGNVWVIDENNSRVQEFNHNGKYVAQFGSRGSEAGQFIFSWPSGILADPKGYLWVTDGLNGRIQKWSYANANSEISSEVTIDGKQVDSGKASCIGTSCPVGSEWILESPSYPVGEHVVKVKATDGLGRSTTKTLNVGVQRDTTKPAIELSGGLATAPEGWVRQKKSGYGLTASATDQGGGVTSLAVKIDGNTIEAQSQGCVEGGCGESITKSVSTASYAGGAHSAEVIATDGAGNTAERSWTINVDPNGQISATEAEDTLEALDETSGSTLVASNQETISAEEREDGYDPHLVEGKGVFETEGTPDRSIISTDPEGGLEVELPEGESISIEPTDVGAGATSPIIAEEAATVSGNTSSTQTR